MSDRVRHFTFEGHLVSRVEGPAYRIKGDLGAATIDEAVAVIVPKMREYLLSEREEPGREGRLAQLKEIRLTVKDVSDEEG